MLWFLLLASLREFVEEKLGQWAKIGSKNIYFNSGERAASRNFLPSPSISVLSLREIMERKPGPIA